MAKYYETTDRNGHLHTRRYAGPCARGKFEPPITQDDLDKLDQKAALAKRELPLYLYPEILEEYSREYRKGRDCSDVLDELYQKYPQLGGGGRSETIPTA